MAYRLPKLVTSLLSYDQKKGTGTKLSYLPIPPFPDRNFCAFSSVCNSGWLICAAGILGKLATVHIESAFILMGQIMRIANGVQNVGTGGYWRAMDNGGWFLFLDGIILNWIHTKFTWCSLCFCCVCFDGGGDGRGDSVCHCINCHLSVPFWFFCCSSRINIVCGWKFGNVKSQFTLNGPNLTLFIITHQWLK
jgi:hypothetical protein